MSTDKRDEKRAILGELESIKDLLNEDEFADIPTLDDSLAAEDIPVLTQQADNDADLLVDEASIPTLEPFTDASQTDVPQVDGSLQLDIEDIPLLTPEASEPTQAEQDNVTAMEWEATSQAEDSIANKAEEIYSDLLSNIESATELPEPAELVLPAFEASEPDTNWAIDTEAATLEESPAASFTSEDSNFSLDFPEPPSESVIADNDQPALINEAIHKANHETGNEIINDLELLPPEEDNLDAVQETVAPDSLQSTELEESEVQIDLEAKPAREAESELDDDFDIEEFEVDGETIDPAAISDQPLPPLSQVPYALPGQQSLFEHGDNRAQKGKDSQIKAPGTEERPNNDTEHKAAKKESTKATKPQKPAMPKARGENPFLPQHIRDRLHTNKPLVDVIKEHPPAPELHTHPTNHVVEAVLAEFMPKIEAELRERLLKLADEGRLDEEKPL